ncbi:site-specific integrase [Vibrio parahaemolyticus]|uniref:site-specific integrase n=1 Tax=Vibrio parahaemolyticus TaxID=670 RepID=UPI00186970F0|nr:site-specific integrase [Vibrio parahaemolyticus]MBE3761187.1 site-specific integrase [Vibrio parahaemolyticus]MBE3793159.1 site-specific integrase [Vibrio parahaemolyticus]HBC3366439.1 site-specific integrase [Vibrio parahaemolyticus]HCE1959605.1 site-specific integrase [Vibrio parahaemolyticus]HCG5141606.1 site-specific integrase [Vibrio parahaemolyticus]
MFLNILKKTLRKASPPVTENQSTPVKYTNYGNYFTPKSQKTREVFNASELVKQFIKMSKEQGQLSPKTLEQYKRHLRISFELLSFEDLNDVDRENAERLLLLLYKFPKNPEKNPVLKGYKGIELVEVCEQLSCDVISRRTVKKIVNLLSTFFNWAKNRGHVDENPFHRLKVRQALTTDCRYQFSNDELTRVFEMKDYQKGKYLHSYYYWIPLLLRFTGARLNELCQLYKADIVLVNKIWGIRICAKNQDQRLKSNSSMRFVPLHHALISRGFLEFVESCTSDRLFNELPLVNGYFSHYASKWFARRRKDLGLGRGKDAHSFRHSFIDELKQQEVAIDMVQELVGHSSNSITTSVYSRSYKPELLASAISKIDDSHVAHIRAYY